MSLVYTIDKQSTNHKWFDTTLVYSEIYKDSFFPRTIINCNCLDDDIVR